MEIGTIFMTDEVFREAALVQMSLWDNTSSAPVCALGHLLLKEKA